MNNTHRYTLALLLLLLNSSSLFADGFLKVSGTKIVNDKNEEVILRGMGLGGWHVPEGYMFGMSGFANAAWEIRSKIVEVVGPQNVDTHFGPGDTHNSFLHGLPKYFNDRSIKFGQFI